VFQTLAYLFKYLHEPLLADIETLKAIYGPVLAHPRDYIRDFGAQSLAYLLRRLEAKSMSKHACGLLRSMGDAVSVVQGEEAGVTTAASGQLPQLPGDRPAELKDGVASLLFQLCRGVQGGFHSRAEGLLGLALRACRPKVEAPPPLPSTGTQATVPQSQESDVKLARRYQVLQLTLGMLQRYVGVSSAGMVLQLLHGEIAKCLKAWEGAVAAAGQALPAAAKRARSSTSGVEAELESTASAADQASYALSLSAHIGRVAGSLTRWYAVVGWRYSVDAAEPQRVMGTLSRLLRPELLAHTLTEPIARGQSLLLAVNAWKVALTPKVGNKGRKTNLQRMVDSHAARGDEGYDAASDGAGSEQDATPSSEEDESEEEEEDEAPATSGPNTGEAIQKRLQKFTALLASVLTAQPAGAPVPGMVHAAALPHAAAHAVPREASGTALGGHLLSIAWAGSSAATAAATAPGQSGGLCSPSELLGQVAATPDTATAATPSGGSAALPIITAMQPLQLAFVRDLLTMAVGDAEGRAGVAELRAVQCRDQLIATVLPGGMRVIAPAAQRALAASSSADSDSSLLVRCAPLFSALLQMWDALHGTPEITAHASPEVDAATGAARTLLEDLVPALQGVLAPSGRLLLSLEHGGEAAAASLVSAAAAGSAASTAGSSSSKKKGRKSGGTAQDWHAAVLAEQKAKAAAGRKRRRSEAAAPHANQGEGGALVDIMATSTTGVATAMALACIDEGSSKLQAVLSGKLGTSVAAVAALTSLWGALSALPTLHLAAEQVLLPLATLCADLMRACASADWAACGAVARVGAPPLRVPMSGVGAALQHCAAAAVAALGAVALCAFGAGLSAGADLLPYAPTDGGLQEEAAAAAATALSTDLVQQALAWAQGLLRHGQVWGALWRLSDTPDVAPAAAASQFPPPAVDSLFSQSFAQQRALAGGLSVASLRAAHVLLKAANCTAQAACVKGSAAAGLLGAAVVAPDAQGSESEFHPALTRAVFSQWVGAALPTLAGSERTLRLLSLQVLCQFPGAMYALPGQGAGARKAADPASGAAAAAEEENDVAAEGGEGGSESDSDDDGAAEEGEQDSLAFEGHCPVPLLAFRLELLPKTMLTQRAVVIRITRLRRMLELRVLPAEEAALAAALSLGMMHVRYAALWKPVSSMLKAALRVLPDLTWPLLARALLHSTANRASLDLSQAALVHACLQHGPKAAVSAVRSAPKSVQRLADASDMSGDLAVASAVTGAAGTAVAASPSPALASLAVRLGLTALYGTVGADALMPSVQEHVGDLNAARAAQGAFTHGRLLMAAVAREQVRSLGAAGRSDANTMHRSLTSLLRVAPKFARLRAAVVVPMVLGSTMRDYYGAAARNDPDAVEVALPAAMRRLATLPNGGIEGKAVAVTTTAATVGGVQDSSMLPNAASPVVVLACILEGVPQAPSGDGAAGVLADPRAVDGATPLDMIAADTTRRLSNWLGVLGAWRSWAPVPEYATMWALGVRLLGKPDGGISKAALALVMAFGPPHATPYRESLQGLVTDQTFRSELTRFSPSPDAEGGIGTEHRGSMLPLLMRMLFGRVSARSGVASRAALHARRAAILAYVGGMHRRELAFLVYLTLRAFTVSMAGEGDSLDAHTQGENRVSANGSGGNLFGFAPQNSIDEWLQGVYHQQQQPGAAHAKWDEGGADPASEADVAQLVDQFSAVLEQTPASRAVGFLNLLPHMVKQLAHRLRGYLHLLLAPVAALYKATANSSDVAWSSSGPGRASAPISSRAQEIRGLCLQRFAEVVRQFPGYAGMPHFFAHLAETMAPGIAALPKHASTGDRSPYMLRLLEAVASQRGTAPLLACDRLFPGAATAALRCLTAGMGVYQPGNTGSGLDANSQALAALGLPTQADVTVASVITGRSPGVPILNAAFAVTEALLGAAYGHTSDAFVDLAEALKGASGTVVQRVLPTEVAPKLVKAYGIATGLQLFEQHMPLLLHQLTVRIAARGRVESLMTAIAEGDVEGVQLADVDGEDGAFVTAPTAGSKQAQARRRGMVRAFARRELTLTTRAAECMAAQASNSAAGAGSDSGQLCARLFALLLPQVVPSQRDLGRLRAASSSDGPTAAEVAVVGGSAAGGVGRRDPRDDILHVLDKLVFSVPASHRALHIPLLSGLLAPGPFAVLGGTRRSVLALLGKLVAEHEAVPAEGQLSTMQLLQRLTAVSSARIGATDFDAILAAQRTAAAGSTLQQLLPASGTTRAVPALLHQLLAGLHDDDVAVSSGAASAVAAVISHLTGSVSSYLKTASSGQEPSVALVLAPWFTWCAVADAPPKGVSPAAVQACAHLALLWECVLPALRASLAAGADTVRRAVVGLLGHAASGTSAWPAACSSLVDVSALVGSKGQWLAPQQHPVETLQVQKPSKGMRALRAALEASAAALGVAPAAGATVGGATSWEAWMTTPLSTGPALPSDCPLLHTRPVQGCVSGVAAPVPLLSLHSLLHADLAALLAWPADELAPAARSGGGGAKVVSIRDVDDDEDDEETAPALPGAAADSAALAKATAKAKAGETGEVATRDLLNGLAHIKVHKRARSARRIAVIVQRDIRRGAYDVSMASGGQAGPALSIATVQHVLLPLALHSLYDHSTAPGKRKGKTIAAQWHELQREAAGLVAACAGALPWPSYVGLLARLARLIGEQDTDAPLQKALLASLAGALDAMRFEVAEELPANTTVVISGSMTWEAQRRLQASRVKRETRVQGMAGLRASLGADGAAEPTSDADSTGSLSDEEPADSDGETEEDTVLDAGAAHDTQLSWAQRLRYVLTPAASTPEAAPAPSEVARHLYVRILPKLKLLLQPMPKAISAQDARVTPAGASGTDPRRAIAAARLRRDAPTTAPLRTPIALALVKLLKRLPQSVFITELPPVLTRITGVLQSKSQLTRNVTKTAVVQTAVELGAQYLPYMITALTGTLKEGFMVHVRGHAVHAVLAGLVHAGELACDPAKAAAPGGAGDSASDSGSDSDEDGLTTAQQSLVSCMPGILDVVMMDVMGAVSLARQKDSGYRPKVALAEAKSCKSYDTYALLARCIPFLPHPAVHALLAPPLLALSTQGTVARVRQAVDELLKGAMGGLLANPAVQAQPEALLSLTFCLVRDNLMTSGVATAEAMKAASNAQEDVNVNWRAKKAKMEAKARVGAAAASGDTQALLDAARASVALRNESAQRIRRHTLGKATAWIVGDAYSAMEAAMPAMLDAVGVGSGTAASATLMSAGAISASAARLTAVFENSSQVKEEDFAESTAAADASAAAGAVVDRSAVARAAVHAARRVTAFPQDTFKIAAEPKRRYRVAEPWTGEAAVQAGGGGGGTLAATKLVWMGLTLLQAAMRKGVVDTSGEGPLAHLDPFVPLLAHTLSATRQTDILRLALKAIAVFMPKAARLPSVAPNATVIARSVLRHARAAAGGGRAAGAERDELAQAAVKATTALIRHVQEVTLGTAQLSALLLLVQADLENPKRQGSTFDLLRSVLGRRFVAPELYDTMDQVSHFMVQAPKSSTRALCARTFLTYLLHYPLSTKRLTGYMHFFLSNLAYSQSQGRLAVLDMLLAIIKAFPQEVLSEHGGVIFVPLVQRLGLEPATDVRAGVGAVLQALLGTLPPLESRKLLDMCVAWASSAQPPAMRRVGLHGLCLAAAASPELVAPLLDSCLERSLAELQSAVASLDASEARIQAVYDDTLREASGVASLARQTDAWWDAGEDEEGGEGGGASSLSSAMAALGTAGTATGDDAAQEAAAAKHARAVSAGDSGDEAASPEEEEEEENDEAVAVADIAADAGGLHAHNDAAGSSEDEADAADSDAAGSSDDSASEDGSDDDLLTEAADTSDKRKRDKRPANALPAGAIVVPAGLGGGGGVILGGGSDAGASSGGGNAKKESEPERIAFAAAAAAARREGESLPWETAYYATLLQERLWEAHGAALSSAVAASAPARVEGAAAAPSSKRPRGKKGKKKGADPAAVGSSALAALAVLPSIAVFPHAWVRSASARWLKHTLAQEDVGALQPVATSTAVPTEQQPWLSAEGRLFALMRAMCVQLSDTTLSPEHGEALAPVLLFGAVGLWNTTPETKRNVLPGHLVQRVLDARGTPEHPDSEEIGGADVAKGQLLPAADDQAKGQDPLFWLMNRLCNVAVSRQGTAARTALNVLGALSSHVPAGALARYAVPITRCVFRVMDAADRWAHSPAAMHAAEWSAGARQAAAAAAAGELAQTVMPVLSGNMGEEVFSAVFNHHRAARTGARQARVQAAARTAVVDPTAHAAAKRVKAEGKKRNKTRRMDAYKTLRGAGVKRAREE